MIIQTPLYRNVVIALAALICAAGAVSVDAARPEPTSSPTVKAGLDGPNGYYRFPALGDDCIVFAAEGDLWRVPLAGGTATRLTSHPGDEFNPVISPDGKTVAFAAQYEGPTEVYTMPLSGGAPTRRTYLGQAARPVAFTPAGEVVFATNRYATLPATQLATIDLTTNTIKRVPLAQACEAAFDGDGNIYFTRLDFQGSHTRRYEGGTAQQIWSFPLNHAESAGGAEATNLTADYAGTSAEPMFYKGRVYFRSDRDKDARVMNIWSMTPAGKDLKQHTHHSDFNVQTPSLRNGKIVYQQGADLWIYDIAADKTAKLEVRLSTDLDQTREKWVTKPFDLVSSAHVSPDGEKVVLTARGQVFVAPRKFGRFVEATRKDGVRYRDARFLPGDTQGNTLLTLSDQSGEVELWTLPANGLGDAAQLTSDADVLRWEAVPSPDGKRIAHHDKNQRLWIYDVEKKTSTKIDENQVDNFASLAWSPDSRFLAYAAAASNLNPQIKLYSTVDGTLTILTADRTASYSPAWSPDGKFIYFLSERQLSSVVSSPWGLMAPEPFFDKRTKIYAIGLQQGLRSPFAEPDELQPKDKKKDADKAGQAEDGKKDENKDDKKEDKKDEKKAEPKPIEIALAGIQERVYPTPFPANNYGDLTVNDKALFFTISPAEADAKTSLAAAAIDEDAMKKREWKVETVLGDIKGYELSGDGKRVMIRTKSGVYVADAAASKIDDPSKVEVDLSGWSFSLVPREEWRQMFNEAWRLHRDYFYDRGMHGVDWKAVKAKYSPLVDRVVSRPDLSNVLGQMIGELSALHHFVVGGDMREGPDQIGGSTLGAMLERDQNAGGYVIRVIYHADPDHPESGSPLMRPDLDVKEGDVIEKINGIGTLTVADPAVLLRNKAGRQVLLHVRRPGADQQAREVIVKPMSVGAERGLRWNYWRDQRRRLVEDWGQGDIGYVHLQAMGAGDIAEFARQFYPVFNRKGLVIDVRNNGGGNIDSWVLSRLMRKAWFFWQSRIGEPTWNMQYAFRGHMVVLCNEWTGSDGEAFTEGFRRLGLGKVYGTRTWGGEIWLSFSNYLVDNGIASAAEIGVYGPEGTWLIEGRGVEPDVVVDNLPGATFRGEDAQLKAAVEHLQQQIKEQPVVIPPAPKRPDKSFKGRP